MADNAGASIEDLTRRLAERLEALRRDKANLPEQERRDAFRGALDRELAGLGADDRGRVVAAVRERLIAEARAKDDRIAALEQKVRQLESRAEQLSSERDEAARAGAAKAGTAGDSAALGKIIEGLLEVTKNKDVTADSLGLRGADADLFRLVRELLDFALSYELGILGVLGTLGLGTVGHGDSLMQDEMLNSARDRYRACLEHREGAVEELKKALDKTKSFPSALHSAYSHSVAKGSHEIVAEFDVQPLLEKHKGVMGVNHDAVWKALSRTHAELSGATKTELWERFFDRPFREKLDAYVD